MHDLTSDTLLTIYKMVAPLGAAAFALLGLLNRFKDPLTNKLTNVGVISVIGIACSALLGTAAGVIERNREIETSNLQAAQLLEIQRSTSLFDQPILKFWFSGSFENLQDISGVLGMSEQTVLSTQSALDHPIGLYRRASFDIINPNFTMDVNFIDEITLQDEEAMSNIDKSGYPKGSSLTYFFSTTPTNKIYDSEISGTVGKSGNGMSWYMDVENFSKRSNGKIISWLDLKGKSVLLTCHSVTDFCKYFTANFEFKDKSGRSVKFDDCKPKKMVQQSNTFYRICSQRKQEV